MKLAIKGGNPELGFTAPETALASFGACILSNVNKKADALGIKIEDARIVFHVMKRNDPLGFETVNYDLELTSSSSEEELKILFKSATTDGTATKAMLEGFVTNGNLQIVHPV